MTTHFIRRTAIVLSALSALAAMNVVAQPKPVVVNKASADDDFPRLPPLPGDALGDANGDLDLTIDLPRAHHPWARFEEGAWRQLKVTTESFDPTGKLISRAESLQTDTLVAVDETTYTLETVNLVNVGGKELRGAPERTTYHRLFDAPGELVDVAERSPANLTLDNRTVPCQRWELTYTAGSQLLVQTIYYNPDLSPYVLRRETAVAPGEGDAPAALQSSDSVVRVDVPVMVEEEMLPAAHIDGRANIGDRRIDRLEVHCDAAPGGVVSSVVTERDPSGRRVRWTVTELVESGDADDAQPRRRWRFFERLRERREAR